MRPISSPARTSTARTSSGRRARKGLRPSSSPTASWPTTTACATGWASPTTTSSAPPRSGTSGASRRSSAASRRPAISTPRCTRGGTARRCETFYTEKELGPEKTCPVHGTPVEWKSEDNVFFRLSKYQQPLLDLYEKHPEFVRPATPPQRGALVRGVGAARSLGLPRQRGVGDPVPRPAGPDGLRLARRPDELHQRPGLRPAGSTRLYEKFWETRRRPRAT